MNIQRQGGTTKTKPGMTGAVGYAPKSERWHAVLENSLLRRTAAHQLERAFSDLFREVRIDKDELARVLLSFRSRRPGGDDPLLLNYAQLCILKRYISTGSLLLAVLGSSRFAKKLDVTAKDLPGTGIPTCEERMLTMLAQVHLNNEVEEAPQDMHGTVYALTRFVHAVTEYETGRQLEDGALHTLDSFAFGTYEALATLLLSIYTKPHFKDIIRQPWWKHRRGTIVTEIEGFDRHVLQWMGSQLGGRLTLLLETVPFLPLDDNGVPLFTNAQILRSISDLPVIHTRAALFIWLSACLMARPQTDDMAMLAYLQARFSTDNQTVAVDFLLACFDVFTSFFLRKEPDSSLRLVRSFICNKVPLLLSLLSGFITPPMTVDTSIQMALVAVFSTDAIPPLSEGSKDAREKLKQVRAEFLQACLMHGLVTESAVHSIAPQSSPHVTKTAYTKNGLLAQCNNNVSRLEALVNELETTVGNACAISQCVVESINNLCIAKDTMALKAVCNILIRKIPSLDVILQYVQPETLLSHCCILLNEWVHDQDQAELTPSYEEFASILLFVYAATHRYELQLADIGLSDNSSFVAKLLQEKSLSKPMSELTEDQTSQLGTWIHGLYDTDEHGEPSGISDEVMRQCPPQAFFALAPTLFEQSVLACRRGALQMKTFKGGLELLVEPFLLPSLICGLGWLAKDIWEDNDDTEIVMQVLSKLLKPSSSSTETKAMHRAVLTIVAEPLSHALQTLASKKSDRKDIVGLLEILRPHLHSSRGTGCSQSELESWTSHAQTEPSGMVSLLHNAVAEQVAWASNIGPTPPPKYTHRIYTFATQTLGSEIVLNALVEAIAEFTSKGQGPIAFDVCTAMITAPGPDTHQPVLGLTGGNTQSQSGRLSVRDVLNFRIADAQSLLGLETSYSEAQVRLQRRVEAQLVASQMTELPLPLPMQNHAAEQIMADLGLADHPVGNAPTGGALGPDITDPTFGNTDLSSVLATSIDLANVAGRDLTKAATNQDNLVASNDSNIFDGLNLNFTQGEIARSANVVEDDIFADLDMGLDDDLNNFL